MTQISHVYDTMLFGNPQTDAKGNSIPDPNAVYTQTGPSIANLPERATASFDDQVSKITSQLTPDQQSMIAEHVSNMHTSFERETLRYQHEEAGRMAEDTFRQSADQAVHSASLNYRNPDATPMSREMLANARDAMAARGGKFAQVADESYKNNIDALHEGVVGSYLADDNVGGAQRYLNQWKGDLSSGKVTEALENHIRAAGDRIEAKQKDGARDSYEDALKGALAGIPQSAGLVSDRQLQLLHPNTWQRERQFLNNATEAGSAEKQYDQMPASAVIADAQSRQPTSAQPGLANDVELGKMTAEAAKRSIDRRNADPAAFVINGGSAGWQPLDFSKPQQVAAELSNRASTAPQIGQNLQMRIPLLSKDEAKAMGSQLENLPADQRLQALTGLHQALPDERAYFSVLGQVMPHSPVTAIVGQKIDRPDMTRAPLWYDPKAAPSQSDGATILKGETLLNPPTKAGEEKGGFKQGFPMPSEEGTSQNLHSYFARQSADVFRDRPELADAHYSAFRAAYAGLASQDGDLSGKYDSARAQKALQMAVGQTRQINSSEVVVPNGMDPNKLPGLITNAIAATAQSAGAKPGWERAIKGYGLREVDSVGSGRYVLTYGNADVRRPDHKGPFMIDLQQQYGQTRDAR